MRLACLLLALLLAPVAALAQGLVAAPAVSQADLTAAQSAAIAAATAAAPVKSVNQQTGNVVVAPPCRQQSASTPIPTASPASLTWSFPLANNPQACNFATPPSCWSDISTTASGSVFDYPLGGARTTSGVTYTYTAHASTVAVVVAGVTVVSVGGVSGAPPSGSTVVLTCTAPPA